MVLKVGDNVKIIAGRDKGSFGKVKQILKSQNKVIIEGFNVRIKHQKPVTREESGSIIQKELPMHRSNVMLCDSNLVPSRIRVVRSDKTIWRISKKTGEKIL